MDGFVVAVGDVWKVANIWEVESSMPGRTDEWMDCDFDLVFFLTHFDDIAHLMTVH